MKIVPKHRKRCEVREWRRQNEEATTPKKFSLFLSIFGAVEKNNNAE